MYSIASGAKYVRIGDIRVTVCTCTLSVSVGSRGAVMVKIFIIFHA